MYSRVNVETFINEFCFTSVARPIESHSGAQETIIAGALSQPHSVCAKIEMPKLPRWGPQPKTDFMHI